MAKHIKVPEGKRTFKQAYADMLNFAGRLAAEYESNQEKTLLKHNLDKLSVMLKEAQFQLGKERIQLMADEKKAVKMDDRS